MMTCREGRDHTATRPARDRRETGGDVAPETDAGVVFACRKLNANLLWPIFLIHDLPDEVHRALKQRASMIKRSEA